MEKLFDISLAEMKVENIKNSEFTEHGYMITTSVTHGGAQWALTSKDQETAMKMFNKIQNDLRRAFEDVMQEYFEPPTDASPSQS